MQFYFNINLLKQFWTQYVLGFYPLFKLLWHEAAKFTAISFKVDPFSCVCMVLAIFDALPYPIQELSAFINIKDWFLACRFVLCWTGSLNIQFSVKESEGSISQ